MTGKTKWQLPFILFFGHYVTLFWSEENFNHSSVYEDFRKRLKFLKQFFQIWKVL